MARALSLGIPYVVTFHGGGHSSDARNKVRRLQRRLLGPLLRRAAKLVAIARFEISDYGAELGLGPERFETIPNGTDLAFSAGSDGASRNGTPLVATVGRLERYKGHHRVIAAFPEVLRGEPRARLLVVGTGPHEQELRRQAEQLGIAAAVEFTSTPPDQPTAMADLLGRVSLVVLMSEFESHPLVALEAAAAGCRLLVADAGGLAELAEDGLARAIPLDEDPAAVGRAVLDELALPPQTKRPELISWDDCAARLLDLYRLLA
jgi:glycogen(starch) synthase